MNDKVQQATEQALAAIAAAQTGAELEQARVASLGRRGTLALMRRGLGSLPPEQRPAAGKLVNEAVAQVEQALKARGEALEAAQRAEALQRQAVDVTLPGRIRSVGRLHPLTRTLQEMIDIFIGLGFAVAEGPEVDTYYYNFTALNYPEDHPAMDAQMTFYVTDHILLRSQTSTVQIRTMESQPPPVRVVAPGRCHRPDTVDATHCHTFTQLEGLLVDRGVTFADLKGTLDAFAKAMFGRDCEMRFRPDFFPFTEPSAEFALTCILCRGAGCPVCKRTGWLEVGGCGMVDPNVLDIVGYDSEEYTGFAFGFGVDRFVMLRHEIHDIRLLFENDMRLLTQI